VRAAATVLIGLAAILAYGIFLVPSTAPDWCTGRFWTYKTKVVAAGTGENTAGEMTFLVVGPNESSANHHWYLAAITQWFDGSEILFLTSSVAPTELGSHLRWPQVVDHIPPAELPGIRGELRQSVGSYSPSWAPSETSLRLQSLKDEVVEESITLIGLPQKTVVTPAGTFEAGVGIEHVWSNTWGERTEGEAWWSAEVVWWVRVDGQEFMGGQAAHSYQVSLLKWGILASDEVALRLSNAITSTAAIDADWADGLRARLDHWDIDHSLSEAAGHKP